jgi:hypothetical protein
MVLAAMVTVAYAEPQDKLTPLLIDLDGWKAEKAEGMSMSMGQMRMINAVRPYEKDGAELNAMLMLGSGMMSQGQLQEMQAESASGKMEIVTIDGFKVQKVYNKQEQAGAVIVHLTPQGEQNGMFMLSFEGISVDVGLKLARQFDWTQMKKQIVQLMKN